MATESPATPVTPGFPIVGIGASAGGLVAFEKFFAGMPADVDPQMAFVLIQHLAPDHKSILADLIQRYTRMQVFEVVDGMKVCPNCAYIIPPGSDMALLNGVLHLMEINSPRGQHHPIDFFFRSLAKDQGEHAIAIVLSGTGSDGTLGVRAIKGEGGMVMAQTPSSCDYDGMPRSAISTGVVDFELMPAAMAGQIINFVNQTVSSPLRSTAAPATSADSAMSKIFILLRVQTGHDFSQYKPSSILRRVERRMAVQQVETLDGYVKYLQQTPAEVQTLFRDLLIGVTHFFRDPEVFNALDQQIFPQLCANRTLNTVIRIWVPGCSTGEEAYSIAILLLLYLERTRQHYKVQLFATDIDHEAISVARIGLFPESIALDIPPERLARFFTAEAEGSAYRIHKNVRDLVIFSEQSLIKDPPFSKMDLISCRNLLIYLNGELQKKVIPLFHYALQPGGFLLLGSSETVGEFGELFNTLERKLKIYQRKESTTNAKGTGAARFLSATVHPYHSSPPSITAKPAEGEKIPLRELTEQALLAQFTPACAVVNDRGDILYLHGRTGTYLEPAQGETGNYNILRMAREGLHSSLSSTLQKAVKTRQFECCMGLNVKTNGDFTKVNLTVCPLVVGTMATTTSPLFLVVFENASAPASIVQIEADAGDKSVDIDERITALQHELRAKDEYLQTTTEELKSSNEELQSINEELQSTNEELETSKEELQSVNEELATVNNELQIKVADLSSANNDMNNLLAGTGIATVFVDPQLCILRFTPTATHIINLIHADIGRPIGHFVSNLVGYSGLVDEIHTVLESLVPKEREVQTIAGVHYIMRILPYRTIENTIEGIVITFMEMSGRKTQ